MGPYKTRAFHHCWRRTHKFTLNLKNEILLLAPVPIHKQPSIIYEYINPVQCQLHLSRDRWCEGIPRLPQHLLTKEKKAQTWTDPDGRHLPLQTSLGRWQKIDNTLCWDTGTGSERHRPVWGHRGARGVRIILFGIWDSVQILVHRYITVTVSKSTDDTDKWCKDDRTSHAVQRTQLLTAVCGVIRTPQNNHSHSHILYTSLIELEWKTYRS